jgi:hypothetical protein
MSALMITTEANEDSTTGLNYLFTRSNIDYTIIMDVDCVQVWKRNNQRGTMSNDCFWNGVNNQGRPMAKFLKQAVEMIAA